MHKVVRILKNVTFLLFLCGSLALSTVSFAMQTVRLTAEVADLSLEVATISTQAAAAALQHRKALAKAVAKAKAKGRLRRVAAAIPILGIGAVAAFERADYLEWQGENPEGTMQDYSCEMASNSAEVIDEVLQELPEKVRPSRDLVLAQLPDCDQPKTLRQN